MREEVEEKAGKKREFSFCLIIQMSDDALFDVFDQEEPSVVVELPKNTTVIQTTTTTTTSV